MSSPIVVGALGGSGTRAVARALETCGVFMGTALNDAHDNLWFTLLCKRPRWLPERLVGQRPAPEVVRALEVLAAMMTGRPFGPAELAFLEDAAAEMAAFGHDDRGSMAGPPARRLLADYLAASPRPVGDGPWGWKEPNSHLVLPELVAAFPQLRYVHVVRHPLDMAWSRNTTQLRLWGPLHGIDETGPAAQVAWWLESTRRAAETAAALPGRFLLLRYEELCSDAVSGVAKLAGLAGLNPDDETLGRAAACVVPSASIARWRGQSLEWLTPELLAGIRALGYDVTA